MKQARKGVLDVEGAISNNNPPKQVKHDDSIQAVQHPSQRCCVGDGLVDDERGRNTPFPASCA